MVLIKLSSTSANEFFILIHFDYDCDYVLDTLKGLIQLDVAQYEMKRVYSDARIFHKFAKGAVVTARAGRRIE